MTRQLAYGTVRDHPRRVIYVVRVLDEILDYPEIEHVTEQMRSHVTSRYGEQTPNIVIVQGDSKETLRLFGESHAVTRVRTAFIPRRGALVAAAARLTGPAAGPAVGCPNRYVSAKTRNAAGQPHPLPAKDHAMLPPGFKIIDISLDLDPKNFAMRTPAGFKKDMQFAMEVIKEHDAPGGAGQIVRGVHMRLHAGSHVDAPEHNVRGGTQIHELPLDLFIGDAVIADLRDKLPGKAITEDDLQKRTASIKRGDRLMLRTDLNNGYDGGSEKWMKQSPYLTIGATMWCIDKGAVIVGYDFYHGNDEPNAPRVFHNSRTLSEHGVITMPYLKNLDRIGKDRFTLIGLPLKLIDAEASPIRAVALV